MRPIDADELEKSLENYSNNRGLVNAFIEFLNVMDEVHTLDVKPVVRGEWEMSPIGAYKCSVCEGWQPCKCAGDADYSFCPWCGADMRK